MAENARITGVAAFVWVVFFILVPGFGTSHAIRDAPTRIDSGGGEGTQAAGEQQGKSARDIGTAQKIRRAIVEDRSLSTEARNVKIFTSNGVVTLRGPVRTEEEKRIIEDKAERIAGRDRVRNEIDVAPEGRG
jgi:hypothetical protein